MVFRLEGIPQHITGAERLPTSTEIGVANFLLQKMNDADAAISAGNPQNLLMNGRTPEDLRAQASQLLLQWRTSDEAKIQVIELLGSERNSVAEQMDVLLPQILVQQQDAAYQELISKVHAVQSRINDPHHPLQFKQGLIKNTLPHLLRELSNSEGFKSEQQHRNLQEKLLHLDALRLDVIPQPSVKTATSLRGKMQKIGTYIKKNLPQLLSASIIGGVSSQIPDLLNTPSAIVRQKETVPEQGFQWDPLQAEQPVGIDNPTEVPTVDIFEQEQQRILKENLERKLAELNPDYAKMQEFLIFSKDEIDTNQKNDPRYANRQPIGWCLQDVGDVLVRSYPEMGMQLRNANGITSAAKALEKMRTMDQFREVPIESTDELSLLPDGAIIGWMGSEANPVDDVYELDEQGVPKMDSDGKYILSEHAGHISFKLTTDNNEVVLASDGELSLDWYVKNFADAKVVVYVPTGDYQQPEHIEEFPTAESTLAPEVSIYSETPLLLEMSESIVYKEQILSLAEQSMSLDPPNREENIQGSDERSHREMALMLALEYSRNADVISNLQKTNPTYLEILKPYLPDLTTFTEPAQIGDLLFALNAATTYHGRDKGIELMWSMIQSGELSDFGVKPLSQDEINWAIQENIDPRSLAIATFTRPITIDLIRARPDLFLEAVPENERADYVKNLQVSFPNPGAVAALMQYETDGMRHIGDSPIHKEWNTEEGYYPTAPYDMAYIAENLQHDTGLPFQKYQDKIPGSLRLGFGSGGAFGAQFMPIYAVVYGDMHREANASLGNKYPSLTFFDPVSQYIGMGLYLGGNVYQRQGIVSPDGSYFHNIDRYHFKGGYEAGKPERMSAAIRSWNDHPDEINYVTTKGYSYYHTFLQR